MGKFLTGLKMSDVEPLIMYIVLRSDLDWPRGALAVQAAHATTALTVEHLRALQPDGHATAYFAQLETMHKVCLASPSAEHLMGVRDALAKSGIAFRLWHEMPDNVPTCLAVGPIPKSAAKKAEFLRRLKLFA